MNRRY